MFVVKYKGVANEAMKAAERHPEDFKDTWCWVCSGEWGPGGSSVEQCQRMEGGLPRDIMPFTNEEAAHAFMKDFDGHPWYYTNSGEYQVVKVVPRMVQQGWKLAEQG